MGDNYKRRLDDYMRWSKTEELVALLIGAYAALYLCKEPRRTGTNGKGKGTTGRGNSLGIRSREGMKKKKKSHAIIKIVNELSRMADIYYKNAAFFNKMEEEARAKKKAEEARANEMSIAEVMNHLHQVDEVISDDDWYGRCTKLLMAPNAREIYAGLKGKKETLLIFLRQACYEK